MLTNSLNYPNYWLSERFFPGPNYTTTVWLIKVVIAHYFAIFLLKSTWLHFHLLAWLHDVCVCVCTCTHFHWEDSQRHTVGLMQSHSYSTPQGLFINYLTGTGLLRHPQSASRHQNFSDGSYCTMYSSMDKEHTFIAVSAYSRPSSGSCVLLVVHMHVYAHVRVFQLAISCTAPLEVFINCLAIWNLESLIKRNSWTWIAINEHTWIYWACVVSAKFCFRSFSLEVWVANQRQN